MVTSVVAEAILTPTTQPQIISVTYTDTGSGLDASTFDGGDITVTRSSNGATLTVGANPTVTNNADGTFTVEYAVNPPGGTWDAPDSDTYAIALNGNEVFDLAGNAASAETALNSFVVSVDSPTGSGAATLAITEGNNNVQSSNFNNNAFVLTNTGDKAIERVVLDVTHALYPDSVFDPYGVAGDSVKRPLTINTNGGTGVLAPDASTYIGTGGTAGFEKIQLLFDETVNGGFNPGESVGFAINMDPNSIAGTNKTDLDAGSSPAWDVGGVSGAELIGSTFTVTFVDGLTATGQLQGANNQAGAKGLASQATPNQAVNLKVNGLGAGGVGSYGPGGPQVIVTGPAGETARIVLTKGFIQPTTPYAQFLADQLEALAATDFPANNAVEFQTVDVLLTGADQDISDQFTYAGVPIYNFAGEDQLPLGFVASVIDPANNDLPLGPVTQPIYLQFEASNGNTSPIANNDSFTTEAGVAFTGDVAANDSDPDGDALTFTLATGASNGTVNFNPDGTFSYTPEAGTSGADSFTYTASDGQATDMATVDILVNPADTAATIELGLYDAVSDQLIQVLQDGDSIQASTLPSQELTLVATVLSGSPLADAVESIQFNLNNGEQIKTESFEPYTLFGDSGTDYTGGTIPLGNNMIALQLYDQNGGQGTLLETLTVNFAIVEDAPFNTPPVANDDSFTTEAGVAFTGDVAANDSDPDDDALAFVLTADASNGTVTFNSDGTFSYTPDAGTSGSDSFTYEVSDGQATDTATVDILVNPTGTVSVIELGLYNAGKDQLIQTLQDGDTIDSSTLSSQQFAIAARVIDSNPLAAAVESIFFNLNQGQTTRTENVEPYALFGDSGGNFYAGNIPSGSNTLDLEVYDQNKAQGQLLEAVSVNFTWV